MKLKRYVFGLLAVLLAATLFACGKEEGSNVLQICVGSESVWFYQEKLNEYVTENNLPFTIKVTGVDTGKYAETFLLDTSAGADIFVAAHDKLGKLTEGSSAIAPITDEDLIENIDDTVDPDFQDVVYMSVGGAKGQYYAVPIMRQALVLYYNKDYFNNASECDTWEEILAVAKTNNKLATTYLGSDGFNYSHWLLAQPSNEAAKAVFGENGSLQIYKGGDDSKNYTWGDDQVAISKYAQRFTNDVNGRSGAVVDKDGWESELDNDQVVTVIGGAWSVGSVEAILGEGNYGVTVLPKFTLTEEDAYGTATAGMEFQSGSFYDVKCLMKKKGSKFAQYLDDIMYFMTTEEMQLESFINCSNLPAFKDFDAQATFDELDEDLKEELELTQTKVDLAVAQIAQGESAGLPQPFGYKSKHNPAYYSKACPYYLELHQDTETYNTDEKIVECLQTVAYILVHDIGTPTAADVQAWVQTLNK